MKNLVYILVVILAILIVGFGVYKVTTNNKTDNVEVYNPSDNNTNDTNELDDSNGLVFSYTGLLEDVTNGQNVRGINTNNQAIGQAQSRFTNNQYILIASFGNLPEPKNGDFYEGWIVKRSPLDVISTGRLQKIAGQYINTYESDIDLTDHDFYVLTLEPDDNDPAPADHILEGILQEK